MKCLTGLVTATLVAILCVFVGPLNANAQTVRSQAATSQKVKSPASYRPAPRTSCEQSCALRYGSSGGQYARCLVLNPLCKR